MEKSKEFKTCGYSTVYVTPEEPYDNYGLPKKQILTLEQIVERFGEYLTEEQLKQIQNGK
jgi:ribonucleotide reductase beta subunit family protein with ferritin-like domain